MENLFLLLSLGSFVAIIIGIINPRLVVRWGLNEKRTRRTVLKYYGIGMIVFFVAFGVTTDGKDSTDPIQPSHEVVASGEVDVKPSQNNEEVEKTVDVTAELEEDKTKAIKQGTYKIGADLPSGEYLFITDNMGYIEVASDSKGQLESIVTNENVFGHTYITVEDGQYLKIQGGVAYPVEDAPSIVPGDGWYKDGTYKVGSDIPSGEYKVVLKSEIGYVEVNSNSKGGLENIITNENITGDTYITVEDGQYLKLQGVEIQK